MLLSTLLLATLDSTAAIATPILPRLGLELLALFAGSASIIWSIIQWRIKRTDDTATAELKKKEDADRVSIEKFKILSMEVANQHNTIQEAQRQFDRAKLEADAKHEKTRMQIMALEPLPGKVAGLEAKFDVISVQMTTLRDDVKEMKTDLKANNTEMRSELRSILASVNKNS